MAATDGGESILHELSTLTWFYCKSLAFNHPTAIVFIFQPVEGEIKTKPLQDSGARVIEGESVVGKRQKYVWVAYMVRHKKKILRWCSGMRLDGLSITKAF